MSQMSVMQRTVLEEVSKESVNLHKCMVKAPHWVEEA